MTDDSDTQEDRMKRVRDALLARSDWTQLPDAPCNASTWATYRQELRDLPNDPNWPNVNFPDLPA